MDRELQSKAVENRMKDREVSEWKERAGSAEKEVAYVQYKSEKDQEKLKE